MKHRVEAAAPDGLDAQVRRKYLGSEETGVVS